MGLSVFVQDPRERAENGQCQSQAAPVLDPVTNTLFVGFTANLPGCQAKELRAQDYVTAPMLINSTDEGLSWGTPYNMMLYMGPGKQPVPQGPHKWNQGSFGPTKGMTVRLPNGGIRLQLPGENGWSAAVFSDDHGATWQTNAYNRSYTLSPGEMDWTVCTPGTACPPGMKYIMVNREGFPSWEKTMGVQFSVDGVVWGKQYATNNSNNILVGQGHAKPGIVAVPGAFISSQTLEQCPTGILMNLDMSCGIPGTPAYKKRQPDDVVGSGMALMISIDGIHWSLFKKLWPIGGMYTTAAGLTFDANGAALTYGIVFAAGTLPATKTGAVLKLRKNICTRGVLLDLTRVGLEGCIRVV
jgi:hypothetical protein